MAESTKINVATQHPAHKKRADDYQLMRDSIEGEGAIKAGKTEYLAMPAAMMESPHKDKQYIHFLEGADYVELLSPIIDGLQGLVHQKPPSVELPKKLEHLIEWATPDGKDMVSLFQDMTRELFSTGRMGLLPEVFPADKEQPVYLCQYTAESIINWRKSYANSGMSVSLLVLEERSFGPTAENEFGHEETITYRVLRLNSDKENLQVPLGYSVQPYVKRADDKEPVAGEFIEPTRIGKKWDAIPFVCVNAINLEFDVGPIPLLPAARRILSAYQKSASYNRALYLCADPTVVRTGIEKDEAEKANVIGGGNCWNFENPQAKVQFLELSGNSIPFQRDAIKDDFERAEQATGRLFDYGNSSSKQRESADAIRLRQAGQQATTKTVVINAAAGLEKALKNIAVLYGVNPDEVKVTPNLDFAEIAMTAADLVQFMAAKTAGAPISTETIHANMTKGGMTNKTFEEEIEAMQTEGDNKIDELLNKTRRNRDDIEKNKAEKGGGEDDIDNPKVDDVEEEQDDADQNKG